MTWEHAVIAFLYLSGAGLVRVLQSERDDGNFIKDAWWLAIVWPLAVPVAIIISVCAACWQNLKRGGPNGNGSGNGHVNSVDRSA